MVRQSFLEMTVGFPTWVSAAGLIEMILLQPWPLWIMLPENWVLCDEGRQREDTGCLGREMEEKPGILRKDGQMAGNGSERQLLRTRDGVSHLLGWHDPGQVPASLWTCFFQTKDV